LPVAQAAEPTDVFSTSINRFFEPLALLRAFGACFARFEDFVIVPQEHRAIRQPSDALTDG
jgi:hypothetical protein